MKFFNLAFVSVFAFISLISASDTLAACGNIITTVNYGDGPIEEFSPIEDCDNPFNADSPNPFTYNLTLGFSGQLVTENSVITINESGTATGTFSINKGSNFSFEPLSFFQKVGDDYEQVSSVTFLNGSDFAIDALVEGEYVAVLKFELPPVLQVEATPLWKQFLIKLLQPQVANAYYEDYVEIVAVPFTIKYESIEVPAGASSVLFLPGIQASRLYTKGVFGTENQLWEPNVNADVEKLAMTDEGVSIYDIYTKDVIDEVNVLPVAQGNIYKGFLRMLEDLKGDGAIKDYRPFAYDWRFSVQDIVVSGTLYKNELKSLVDEVESLADSSFTGQVTIVGHSNGGLLAKMLVLELERLGLVDLVDKIIFIGTPHIGTPKAIATMLHGYDQQALWGVVINDATARDVMNNMPGAYSLLPSEKYLSLSTEPIISFQEGVSAQPLLDTYGASVTSIGKYIDFLNGEDGRVSNFSNISMPYVSNRSILSDALNLHKNKLDDWLPPSNVEVHNVVGVGLKTIKKIEYRDVLEHIDCVSNISGAISCDEPAHFLRPYAYFTQYGDETVTALSSESVEGERYYFDFNSYRDESLDINRKSHADFTEISEIKDLVTNIINSTSTSIDYISLEKPVFTREYEVMTIDSPVDMSAEDSDGNKTGLIEVDGKRVVLKEIESSEYFEFGGTKYLIVPKDVDVTMSLRGTDYGGYTLTIATLTSDDVQVVKSEIVNATTTPDMLAVFSLIDGKYSTIKTDLDGDGVNDIESSVDGEIIEGEVVTFDTLRAQIKALDLSARIEKKLLLRINLAEKFLNKSKGYRFNKISMILLGGLSKTISQYEKRGLISSVEGEDVRINISSLIDKVNTKNI